MASLGVDDDNLCALPVPEQGGRRIELLLLPCVQPAREPLHEGHARQPLP